MIFNRNNAKVLTNPTNLNEFEGCENVLINPDFKKVQGNPPHLWKIEEGGLTPIKGQERHDRLIDIEKIGLDTEFKPVKRKTSFWVSVKNWMAGK